MNDHGHGGEPAADHVPHVLPLVVYLKTYGALLFLTVLTVVASYLDLGHTFNLICALGIATCKAVTVAAIFMHLLYDQKFFAIIISSSVIFLGIFLAFTMFDTNERGVADPTEHEKPLIMANPFLDEKDPAIGSNAPRTRSEAVLVVGAEEMKAEAEKVHQAIQTMPAIPATIRPTGPVAIAPPADGTQPAVPAPVRGATPPPPPPAPHP
jgi:cytochrome c oxidase subunit 4